VLEKAKIIQQIRAKREAGEEPARSRHCVWAAEVHGRNAVHWFSEDWEGELEHLPMSQETCMRQFLSGGEPDNRDIYISKTGCGFP